MFTNMFYSMFAVFYSVGLYHKSIGTHSALSEIAEFFIPITMLLTFIGIVFNVLLLVKWKEEGKVLRGDTDLVNLPLDVVMDSVLAFMLFINGYSLTAVGYFIGRRLADYIKWNK